MRKINLKIYLLFFILVVSCTPNTTYENLSNDLDENDDNIVHSSNVDLIKITILYTNDEHGYIDSTQFSNGAANMMGLWKETEGYDKMDNSYLVLSGGDNWTGTPISELSQGESVVDVMNAMGYDAGALGNHEFEFGIRNLYERAFQADFPFLSANIRVKATDEIPGFAKPYIIYDINDIKVGIIGLSHIGTPNLTVTEYLEDYKFTEYEEALNEVVPIVKSHGADLVVLIAHFSYSELIKLAPKLIDLGINVAGGGHCHREMTPQIIKGENGSLAVIQAFAWLESYATVDLLYDNISKQVFSIEVGNKLNNRSQPDPDIKRIISYWKDEIHSFDQNTD